MAIELVQRDRTGQQGERGAAGVVHTDRGGIGERRGASGEIALQLEVPHHHAPRFGIGRGDVERNRVCAPLKPERERLQVIGLARTAENFRKELRLNGDEAGRVDRLGSEIGRDVDLEVALRE